MRATILLALAAAAVPWRTAAAEEIVETAHVRVRGELPRERLDAYARLAEDAYPHWKSYFGCEPREEWLPLELVVAADRSSFLRSVRLAGGPWELPGAGGYTWTGTLTSYLYPQPHDSSTRLLVLHELTHQFQYKAVQDGRGDRSPYWHREGLAEHFGFHRRLPQGLEVGVLDVVAIEDRPDQCAERVRRGKIDLWEIGTGAQVALDYTDGLAAVETFLRTTDRALRTTFREWEREVHGGANPGPAFEKAFKGKRDRLAKAVTEVWGTYRRPWKVVYVSWDEEPGFVVGRGEWAVLEGTAPATYVDAEVEIVPPAVGAAVALGMRGPEDRLSLRLAANGEVVLSSRRGREERVLGQIPGRMPAAGRSVRLRLALEGAEAVAYVDGVPAIRARHGLTTEAGAGLLAEGGEVRFRSVKSGK